MDKGLKQILRMSWTLRSRFLCFNYTLSSQIINQRIAQNYWTRHKVISWSDKLKPLNKVTEDLVEDPVKNCLRILDTINTERPDMDIKDIMDVLTVLAEEVKTIKYKEKFMNHEGFLYICEKLNSQIRFMNLSAIISIMKKLTFLNVPGSTFLMQKILQIIRSSVNDLQIDQAHIVLHLLKQMERTSLSSALLIAIPILLPNIITKGLKDYDLHELSIALRHLNHEENKNLTIEICQKIEFLLKKNSNPLHSVDTLKNIFCTLCCIAIKQYSSYVLVDAMKVVQEAILNRKYKLNASGILDCINAISYGFYKGNMKSYNVDFINSLLELAISNKINFYSGFAILRGLNQLQYVYVPFLEYLLSILPNDINAYNINTLLNAFCISDYKAIPWTYIENKLLEETFITNCHTLFLIKCVLYLAALDKYYPEMLSTLFTKANFETISSLEDDFGHYKRLLCLYQSVKTLYTEYEGPWPSEKTLAYLYKKTNYPKKSSLMMKLQIAMGGPQYVLRNLKTKLGHTIDYAILMRKGGYPVAFNINNSEVLGNRSNYIEDLQCPPKSYVILILEFPQSAYSINTLHLTNIWKLTLRSLEKWTGHKCIDINLKIWENLPNHEKTSYFMQKIRNQCDDIVSDV